jgi:hypothetical protein
MPDGIHRQPRSVVVHPHDQLRAGKRTRVRWLRERTSGGGQPARADGMRSPASPGGGCSWATTSGALLPVASIDFFTVAP